MKVEHLSRWSNEASEGLSVATGDDEDIIEAQVNSGTAKLFKINDGDAWMVTRREGTQLVIVCFEGSCLIGVMNFVFKAAKSEGFRSIRFHTAHQSIARMARRFFPVEKERVYEVAL